MSSVASAAAIPSPWRVWMRAVRIFSFTASIIPVLVGSAFALARDAFDLAVSPLILVACVLCHAGCNLANDYFDHRKGIDDGASLGIGGVIQDGWLTADEVRGGMIAGFALATAAGLVVLGLSTWWLAILAVPSLLAAILYTGGPKPLGYHALGEVTVWLFMGMGIVCGTFVAMTERLTWEVLVGSLGISALVAAILHANNLRDFESDRAAGKRTLAHVIGWEWAVREFTLLVVIAYLFTALLVVLWPANWPAFAVAATIPAARNLVRAVRTAGDAAALNMSVRGTAALHFRFGLLLTAGLVVRAALEQLF
jgi:1,4-dihydroxy-2-naphthoate octaprenyltransferase